MYIIEYCRGVKHVQECPDEKTWAIKAKIVCPFKPDEYHCMYDIGCSLVEDCRPWQTNDRINIYFEQNSTQFKIKEVPVMSTNDPYYNTLQQATFCNSNTNHVENSSSSGYKICCITESVILGVLIIAVIRKYVKLKTIESKAITTLIEKDRQIDELATEKDDLLKLVLKLKDGEPLLPIRETIPDYPEPEFVAILSRVKTETEPNKD